MSDEQPSKGLVAQAYFLHDRLLTGLASDLDQREIDRRISRGKVRYRVRTHAERTPSKGSSLRFLRGAEHRSWISSY